MRCDMGSVGQTVTMRANQACVSLTASRQRAPPRSCALALAWPRTQSSRRRRLVGPGGAGAWLLPHTRGTWTDQRPRV